MSPSRERVRTVLRWLCRAEIFLLVLTIVIPTAARAADQILLLDLHLNGNPTGKIGEFTLRGNTLLSRRGELHDLGFQVPASSDSDGLVALSTLPGLTWHLDQKTQTLYVKVSNNHLLPTVLHLDESDRAAAPRTIESGTGVTLNYDIVSTLAGNHNGTSGSLDFRAFSPKGVLSSGLLVHAGAAPIGTGTSPAIRLDSTYQFADIHTLRRYSIGDFITGSLSWTRPIRLAGAQIRSDFSMRPDLVTFPLPSLSGSAAVHSVVDVLTNGGLVLSRQVDAGPFEIPQLPMVTGAGTISMTVTNALGQQTSVTQPFYASSALLAPGLHTFSAQVGAVRRNWGVASSDYGKFAGIANYRRGLNSKITIEGSAEATSSTVMAGGGGVLNVGNLAAVNFAAAGSIGSEGTGTQFSVGGQHIGRRFSLGGSATIAGRQFRDVAAANGDPVPRQQLNANTGLSLKAFGSVGVAYAGLDVAPSANSVELSVTPIQRSHILSASYSVQVHHMSIYATEFHDFTSTGSNGVMVGLTIPFGRRGSVSVSSGSEGGYGQVQVQQSVASIGDWGYQAYVSAANPLHEFAQVQYKSPRGLLLVGADRTGGATSVNLESQGALSFVDGGLFPSNSIYDSFAIVDTGSMAHVHVLQENRDVGSTNSAGRLLVPDMHSFDLNHIAIVPTDIPPDATVDVTSREVRPQDRSGVVIKFPMKISHGALLRLVNEIGAPVPVGSTARLLPNGVAVPVGYDGDAYVEDLDLHNTIEVERPNGQRCSVTFNYQPVPDEIPIIGPLLCLEQRP